MSNIIFGIVIYFTACSVILVNFKPIKTLQKIIVVTATKTSRKKITAKFKSIFILYKERKRIHNFYNQQLKLIKKNGRNIAEEKLKTKIEKKEQIILNKNKIHKLYKNIRFILIDEYDNWYNKSYFGIKRNKILARRQLFYKNIDEYALIQRDYKDILHYDKNNKIKAKTNFLKKITNIITNEKEMLKIIKNKVSYE